MWLYCHLVVICWYISVLLKALKKRKKKEINCVSVLFKKANKHESQHSSILLSINFTFTGI